MKRNEIIKLIESAESIPPTASRIVNVITDPDYEVEEVAKLIKYDPAMTANILRTVNSPYFGRVDKVNTIEEAIVVLGSREVIRIALASAMRAMQEKPVNGYGLPHGVLWKHSLETAVMTSVIAVNRGIRDSGIYFTAGMLHDMGKILLGDFVSSSIDEIKKLSETEKISFRDAERKILGIDHAELGGIMADKWEFPEALSETVKYYHVPQKYPEDGEYRDIVYTVHVADAVCIKSSNYIGIDKDGYAPNSDVFKALGADENFLENIKKESSEEFVRIMKELGMQEG